jgi:hypothetical protein
MGVLDDLFRRGILNGATYRPGDQPPAPFGFAPTADGMIQQAPAQLPAQPMPGFGMISASNDSWQAREARDNLAALQPAPFGIPRPADMPSLIETYRQSTEPKPTAVESDPFATAAARVRRAVQPVGGRREGDLTDALSNIVPQAAESFVAIPQRAIQGSAADLQHFGNHDVPLQSVAPAVDAAMWTMGSAGVVPAEANALRMGIKTYRGPPNKLDTAFATHEAIPGADTGHMTGSINAPAAERAAYSADPRSTWANAPGHRDAIYGGLRNPETGEVMPVRPTLEMQGLYTPPGGVTEANPGWAARPQVAVDAGKVTPADAALLNAGEATRGYIDAQNASAWHVPWRGAAPGDSNSLFIPMRGKATPEQLTELQKITPPHGLPHLVDTGQGITATRFWPPPEDISKSLQDKSGLLDTIKSLLPDAGPQRVKVDSNLIDYATKWPQGIGSGAASRELLSHINALPPQLRDAVNNNPLIPQNALNRMTRDQDWAPKWGAPKEDIQNARRIIGDGPGWVDRLEAALKAGVILPSVAAAIVGTAPHAEEQ